MGSADSVRCPRFVADYIDSLRSRFGVETVILFGSRARGEQDQYSDWDLFVVAAGLAEWKQRVKDVWEGKPPGVDVVAWTPGEVRRFIYRQMILEIALEGVPLYGDIEWMRELARQYVAKHPAMAPRTVDLAGVGAVASSV